VASPLRWERAVLAVLGHPSLWPIGARQLIALARPGWWRRWPPLPVPDPVYLRFRLLTAYGDPDRDPDAADLIAYLKWCRRMRALSR
jgi:hypothetical protein